MHCLTEQNIIAMPQREAMPTDNNDTVLRTERWHSVFRSVPKRSYKKSHV